MESLSGDTEETTEDIQGRKKSKLKSLKTRLFGKSKRANEEGSATLSQSAGDITAGEDLGSEDDLSCSEGSMGSRALSHDSIFLADQALIDAEPVRVLSQDNVHSKIKALQMKLQQQKMHLGPPPLVLPIRRPEDLETPPEDDSLPRSPPENAGGDVTTQGGISKITFQPHSRPLSPIPKPPSTKSVAQTPPCPLPLSVSSDPSAVESPLDFSSPAQFTPCLDTSAARHRMFVKPKKQRASTKKKLAATDWESHLETPNNIDQVEPVTKEEPRTQKEATLEKEQESRTLAAVTPIISQCLPSKPPEVVQIPEVTSKSSSLTSPQQDQAPCRSIPSVPPQVLRVKPHRAADVMRSERPHSSYIASDLKDKRDVEFDMSHDKRNTLNKAGMTDMSSDQLPTALGSLQKLRSSSVHQQVQGKAESTRGIKRPAPGSGSFHFSITTAKNRDGERPRSGSFVGVLEKTEARLKTEDRPFSSMKEKSEVRELQPRGRPYTVGRQDGAQHKSPVLPWERRDSFKKVEPMTPSKTATTDTEMEELQSSQEVVEEAVEAKEVEEDEEKTTFGIKLRSTSQSMRIRSDASSNQNSKPPVCEERRDKQKRQDSDNGSYKKESTSGDVQLPDQAPSGVSFPVKHNQPPTCDPHSMQTELQTGQNLKELETAPVAPQQPQSARQTAPPEVSWMSLAMEKTRSLQQLFTGRFPRDLTGVQAAARPQTQTQTVKIQESPLESAQRPSAEEAETAQSRSQAARPSPMAAQQSTASPVQSSTPREAQTPKPAPQAQANTAASQSVDSSAQPETSSQFAQGSVTQSLAQSFISSGQQQPPWTNRGLQPSSQLKPTASVSTPSPAAPPPPVSSTGRGEREVTVQEKERAALSGRRPVWTGSVSERAAFLEKRAEWTAPPGTKGVEVKKAQTEAQTSDESAASAKTAPVGKDTKPEGRPVLKPAESSPAKVPDRPPEDKWLRKNVPSSSSPSSSPSVASDSSQPSWMELAKRKSMAWSDKSMD